VKKAANEFNQKSEQLVSKINTLMLKRTDIESLIGEDNINMMTDNHSNFCKSFK